MRRHAAIARLALTLGVATLAAPAATLAGNIASVQLPAVTIVAGQGLAAGVSNVADLPSRRACPVSVSFFAADGSQIGTIRSLRLRPGASAAVTAAAPPAGPVRAVVAISDTARARHCAVRADLRVYDIGSKRTRVLLPGSVCLGLASCAAAQPAD